MPKRLQDSHKGTFGKLLCVAGSTRYRGAAALCTEGALRGGCGIVTLASVEPVFASVQARTSGVHPSFLPAGSGRRHIQRKRRYPPAGALSGLSGPSDGPGHGQYGRHKRTGASAGRQRGMHGDPRCRRAECRRRYRTAGTSGCRRYHHAAPGRNGQTLRLQHRRRKSAQRRDRSFLCERKQLYRRSQGTPYTHRFTAGRTLAQHHRKLRSRPGRKRRHSGRYDGFLCSYGHGSPRRSHLLRLAPRSRGGALFPPHE